MALKAIQRSLGHWFKDRRSHVYYVFDRFHVYYVFDTFFVQNHLKLSLFIKI